jgi:hypothetical protein
LGERRRREERSQHQADRSTQGYGHDEVN